MVAGACNPFTQEAEAGESVEPHCSEPRSHHCTTAGATEQDSVSKKKKEKKLGLLGKMADSRSKAGKMQGEPGTSFCVRK